MKKFRIEVSRDMFEQDSKNIHTFYVECETVEEAEFIRATYCKATNTFGAVKEV